MSVSNGATFTMHGGTISGNTAYINGGGVSIASGGTFNMYGGTISGNIVNMGNGGGVGIDGAGTAGGTFNMHGGTISGNTPDDVYPVN